ncbi:hypothetical protein HUO09_07975 [Vibrio sp. Y2-5]|uniref:hypothetical protein n=1 Tax=Vibrio sp. Y2-5 TaxID=2743977 RepID=UPI001660C8CC|nr:hypothetical protein [Vibrio sp. Y2-5]MBD0786280.1 hypothetical protein [Vibrio sp. Y2-5]
MFEPTESVADELHIAISLPNTVALENGYSIATNDLTESILSDIPFDALFVSGLSPKQSSELSKICLLHHVEFVVFDNPNNDSTAIRDVVINLTNKLLSKEMPNNLDLADIRNLNQSSDYLFAFNSEDAAFNFMRYQQLGVVVGGIYLAHGDVGLGEYESTNNALLRYFSEKAILCSSFLSVGLSDCTILLGIKSHSEQTIITAKKQ